MSDDEVDGVLDALRHGLRVWQAADDRGLFDTLKEFFKRQSPIIVFGSTGCGKTNMLASLAASAGLVDAISRDDRTENTEKHRVIINARPFTIIDTPGQGVHKHIRDQEIREAMAGAPLRIINVVSYGYHEYKAPRVGDAVDNDGNPKEEYLSQHRVNELAALNEWLPLLGDRDITNWVMTVVTKADLWWHVREEVADYYESGPYSDLINMADPKLHHVVRYYCSVVHRFFGTACLPGVFDDAARLDLNMRLLSQLSKLIN